MGTPSADKLRVYFPSKYLAADGDPLPQFSVDAGSALNTIVDAALTQADSYWTGALGWFDGNTVTPELRGQFFHVKDFTAATDTLTLSRDLPAVPTAGDTYRLVLGGSWRSSQETFGLFVGGVLPELLPVAGVNITGLTIKKASSGLGTGTLTVTYKRLQQLIVIKMGTQAYGVGLDVSANVANGIIFAGDGQAWLQVDVTAAALPTVDKTDTWTLTYPERTLTPDYEGYETAAGSNGKTRYRLEAILNTDPSDAMVDLSVYVSKPAGGAQNIVGGGSLTLAAGSFDVADASAWPTKSFWIKNKTVNAGVGDCRYVNYRSGNTLFCFGIDWATLAFNTGTSQIFPGDVLTGSVSAANAIVDQVVLISGTWAGGTAAGTLILRKVVGTYTNAEFLRVGGINRAKAAAASAFGLRGYTAVNWAAGQALEPMADVDIGINKPAALQYENPSPETLAPNLNTVVFKDASTAATALAMGTLMPSKLHGVWRREWILDGHQARNGVDADTHYVWS